MATWLVSAALVFTAQAQSAPQIGYVYPAGGRQGATFHIVVGGQLLRGVTNVYLSGNIGHATFLEFNRPLSQNEFNDLRDKFRELQQKKQSVQRGGGTNLWTSADETRMTEIRDRILKNPPNRQGNPALAETVTVQVTLAADAEPGEYELRLGAPGTLSNPLVFCVGRLPEFSRPAAKPAGAELAFLRQLNPGKPAVASPTDSEMRVTLPATVNGQILPGAADRFRFAARKGQRLVAAVSGRALIPYLADAVPGWFQAALTVYDANGKELVYVDDYLFHPDPALCFEVPRDGEYVVEVRDALYRGREDFVYRLTLGELPFVTGVFPLGGPAYVMSKVELSGWNLAETRLRLDYRDAQPGIRRIGPENAVSPRRPFAADTLPEIMEQETRNSSTNAQWAELPLIINGRIDSPGDVDVFAFEARAGREIVAEVYARRLDSPLDSTLTLVDGAGRQAAFNDDREDKGSGLNTHHADSRISATLPTGGTWYVKLADAQGHGGPEYAYRLRLSSPRPDFELRVVPSSVSVRTGGNAPLTVHALRKDGFNGEITLALKDAPAGFALSGARIPANQDQVRITLGAPPVPSAEPVSLALEGRATISGKEVVQPAIPCDDRMQAFAYRHLVPARELMVAIAPRGGPAGRMKLLGDGPVAIPAGGAARVRFGPVPAAFAENFQLELSEPPEGISLGEVTPVRGGVEVVLRSDGKKSAAGLKGNLIVNLIATTGGPAVRGKPGAAKGRRAPAGTLPAVAFEVVENRGGSQEMSSVRQDE